MINRRQLLATTSGATALASLGFSVKSFAADPVGYWHHFTSQTEMKGLADIEGLFEAATGRSVRAEGIPNAQYMSKVTTASVAGGLPETVMVTTDRLPEIHALGAIQPVSANVEGWSETGNFSDAAWQGITLDGETYGVPAFAFVNWAYYRKDWFEEAGLSPPDTYEEFQEAAIALTDPAAGRYGFGMRGGDGGQGYIADVLASYGALIDTDDGGLAFDTDKAREAMQFYADIAVKHGAVPPSVANDSYRQIMEGFKTGQTGMIWHHTGSLTELTEVLNEDQIGTMLMPAGPAQRIARVNYLYNGVTGQGDGEGAWDWIAFWGNPDAAVALLEATGYFPATTAVASDPRITGNPIYQAALDTLPIGTPSPKVVGYAAWLKNTALAEFQKILIGTATVEQAVDNMAREFDKTVG